MAYRNEETLPQINSANSSNDSYTTVRSNIKKRRFLLSIIKNLDEHNRLSNFQLRRLSNTQAKFIHSMYGEPKAFII